MDKGNKHRYAFSQSQLNVGREDILLNKNYSVSIVDTVNCLIIDIPVNLHTQKIYNITKLF